MRRFLFVPIFLISVVSIQSDPAAALTLDHLRCENRIDPLGIDVAKPRLGWILESDRRGEQQTAYEIEVGTATKPVWDSGKVASDRSVNVEYAGPALKPGTAYRWRVRVWDKDGQPSAWSEPASFSTGLRDWNAKWIGYDAVTDESPFNTQGLRWVRLAAGKKELLRQFELPTGRKIRQAILALYADNECRVMLNGAPFGQSVRWERTARLDVTHSLQPGKNRLTLIPTHSDSLPAAVIGRLIVQFESGDDLQIPIDGKWENAQAFDGTPWGTPALNDQPRLPAPYLRKEFAVAKHVRRATVYATALGAYEMHLNGQRVGRDELTPGWTEFRKRVAYQTYDVTSQVQSGKNAIGAILGDGWYASDLAFTGRRNFYGGKPRFLAQLVIEFDDDSTQTISTDGAWKAAHGPILHADLMIGCEYDSRLAMPGWDTPGFADHSWSPVVETSSTPSDKGPMIEAAVAEPSRRQETLPARKITESQPGVYIFDLGQNMVGWAQFKLHGSPGQRITVRYGEMLNPDGTLYTANLRGTTATDFFILTGKGQETLEPCFTFHGFRYVELRGLTAKPDLDAVTGIVVHSDIQRTGDFECSSPLVNQLYHNIIWGQKGNYFEVPTDCPQRDERAGWTGDTQFFVPTAAYNFNVAPFFTRWLTTICEDSQHADGSVAHVSPDLGLGSGATAWGDAAIVCTHRMYRTYGDTRVVAAHYPAMERLMQWYASKSKHLVPNIGGFGDWLNKGGSASREVIDTAYYACLSGMMAEMAEGIGNTEAAERYAKLHADIKQVFAKFFEPDGTLRGCSQTGYALAFGMDLVPDALREKAAGKFAEEIKRFDYHLATGFIGTPRLLPALHLAGRDDLAYRLLLQETYPSWLFQVKLGATTMWERWDGYTPEHGFQDRGMNSFNHYAFGSVGEYLYAAVGGILAETPGYKMIRIEPVVGEGLTWAKTSYDSIHGRIVSNWKLDAGKLMMDVTIPANTTAVIYVPGKNAKSDGAKLARVEGGASVFAVGSGRYRFTAKK